MDPLWAELINSDWHDHLGTGRREDRLENDGWLAPFLHRAGWRGRRLPDESQRARLRALRRIMRRAVDALRAGQDVSARDVAALNGLLAACPERRRLRRDGGGFALDSSPVVGGFAPVLAALAASFADMLAHGDPRRIKICANRACGWVMYDESRNRSRRWCEAAVCGSLIKVRRFRRRQRRAPAHAQRNREGAGTGK